MAKRGTNARTKREFSRFKKAAMTVARKAAKVDRERTTLGKSLDKWARTNKVAARSYAATHRPGRAAKPCKPIIDHPTGPYICFLISSGPGKCVYRCYRI